MKITRWKSGRRVIKLEGDEILDTTTLTDALWRGSGGDPWVCALEVTNKMLDAMEKYLHDEERATDQFMKIVNMQPGHRAIEFKKGKRLDSETLYAILLTHRIFKRHYEAKLMIIILFDGFELLIADRKRYERVFSAEERRLDKLARPFIPSLLTNGERPKTDQILPFILKSR